MVLKSFKFFLIFKNETKMLVFKYFFKKFTCWIYKHGLACVHVSQLYITLKYCFVTEKSPMCQFSIETLHVETHSENSTV